MPTFKKTRQVGNPDYASVVHAKLATKCTVSYNIANAVAIIPFTFKQVLRLQINTRHIYSGFYHPRHSPSSEVSRPQRNLKPSPSSPPGCGGATDDEGKGAPGARCDER
ncbi:hypothetical protein TNCV_4062181 [Trichonephila clavipes]|nr:hypothetical protein TNCV_4062181 [Trichonephila clavipes]